MQDSSQSVSDAIESPYRWFFQAVGFDWNNNASFDHVLSDLSDRVIETSLDRRLQGASPSDFAITEGAAAAELTATLAGQDNGLSMVEIFSGFNPTSPLYGNDLIGTRMRWIIGVYASDDTAEFRQFEGRVRIVALDRSDSTVTITCIDYVETLRSPITFPNWAVSGPHENRDRYEPQLIDSRWVIDHCLRFCGVSPTPYRPTYRHETGLSLGDLGLQFWLTGNGSTVPSVGWPDNINVWSFPAFRDDTYFPNGNQRPDQVGNGPPPLCFRARPHTGDGLADGAETRYWMLDRDSVHSVATFYVAFEVIDGADTWNDLPANTPILRVNVGESRYIQIEAGAGEITTRYRNYDDGTDYSQNHTVTSSDGVGPITISSLWDFTEDTGTSSSLNVGSYESGWVTHVSGQPTLGPTDGLKGLIRVYRYVHLQDIGVAGRALFGEPSTNLDDIRRHAFYGATIDPGKNRLSYISDSWSGEDAWEIIKQVAGAEYGTAFWDETGTFRYWNYDTIRSKQASPVRTVTSEDAVKRLNTSRSLDGIRNVWNVEAGRRRAFGGTVLDAIDPDQFRVPATTGLTFRIWDSSILSIDPHIVPRYSTTGGGTFPAWTDSTTEGYVVQWFENDAWQEDDNKVSGVDIYPYFDSENKLVVNIWNGYGSDARLATDAGEPALRILGSKIDTLDNQVLTTEFRNSIDKYGPRNYRLSGDLYQHGFETTTIPDDVGARITTPRILSDDITIPGDPRLQLGDTIEVQDVGGVGPTFNVQILGINRTMSPDRGLEDTLTVEIVSNQVRWILGSQTHSVLGQSTILTSGDYELVENSDFEENTDGWNPANSSIVVSSDYAYSGSRSMKITPDGTASARAETGYLVAVPGKTHRAQTWVHAPSGYDSIRVYLVWYDKDRATTGFEFASRDVPAGRWVFVDISNEPPANARYVEMWVYIPQTPSPSDVFYIDQATIIA